MAHGVDLSNNNADPADLTGVEFVVVKATEGTTFVDRKQSGFTAQAEAAGIPHGPYHFAHPDANSPDAEAAFFLAHAIPGQFWSLDCETRAGRDPMAAMGPDALAAWCDRFHELAAPALGPGLHYTFRSYADALWPRLARPWGWWLASASGAPGSRRTYAGRAVDVEQWGQAGGVDQDESYTDFIRGGDSMTHDELVAAVIAALDQKVPAGSDNAQGWTGYLGNLLGKVDATATAVSAGGGGGASSLSDADLAAIAKAVNDELAKRAAD